MVIVPGYYEARKKEKKEKLSARSRGGTRCPPPPDGSSSSAHGGALSSDFSQVTNMVIAMEKGDILHISHIENICQRKDISNIPKSIDFPHEGHFQNSNRGDWFEPTEI